MKILNSPTSWFSIFEIVIAMSIFAISITWIFLNDNNFFKEYERVTTLNKSQWIVNDLYGYLLTYKKTYWTFAFHNLISQWDSDNNCNGNDYNSNWLVTDEIDEFCFFYPYINWDVLEFQIWVINSTDAWLEDVYLTNNLVSWNDWISYRKIYGQSNNYITIWLKQSIINEDQFSGFIWVYSPDVLEYIYRQEIILE